MPIEHFPRRAQPWLYRIRRWLMGDHVVVLILGAGIIGRGVSYLPLAGAPPGGSHPAESFLPITWWGIIWVTVGLICVVATFAPSRRLQNAAVTIGVALNFLWAWSFLVASISGDMPRGWVTSIGYGSLSIIVLWAVWRGSRLEVEEEIANELRNQRG